MEQTFITRIIEAALLASQQPVTLAQLQGLFTLDEPAPEGSLEQAITELREASAARGIELVETASGYRFQVQADVHAWVARLWTERQTRYTRATLETLAIIAYRQPITRGEIEQIRGVAVSSNIIKALEEREWIRSVGHRDVPGRPELLGTTRTFLDYFGLKRLEDLPPLSELKDFAELDPQLAFADPDAPKAPAGPAIAAGVRVEADAHPDADADADADIDSGADMESDAACSDIDDADVDLDADGQAEAADAEATTPHDEDNHEDEDIDLNEFDVEAVDVEKLGSHADAIDTDDMTDMVDGADHDDDRLRAGATEDDAASHTTQDAADAATPDHNALVEEDDSTGA